MFRPNLTGQIEQLTGRDIHSRPTYAAPKACPFGPINLEEIGQKTTVRADSSASRGTADEVVAAHARILVPLYIQIAIGDRFSFAGEFYEIVGLHKRYSVAGKLDHRECVMKVLPQ